MSHRWVLMEWDGVVESAIMSERFTECFEEFGSEGAGSATACARAIRLLGDSAFHREGLLDEARLILEAMAGAIETASTPEGPFDAEGLFKETMRRLQIVAAVHLVKGTMVGLRMGGVLRHPIEQDVPEGVN